MMSLHNNVIMLQCNIVICGLEVTFGLTPQTWEHLLLEEIKRDQERVITAYLLS